MIAIYLKLNELYPETLWISEREILHDKYVNGFGKRGHTADGILVFPDGKEIAIEVELTYKGAHRTENILKGYCAQFSIHEVWYFCSENILAMIGELAKSMPFIKMYNLKEYLPKIMK